MKWSWPARSEAPPTGRQRPANGALTGLERVLSASSDLWPGCWTPSSARSKVARDARIPDTGPARGRGRDRAVALGGPRQRALLAISCSRPAGRADRPARRQLWGEEAPRTATASLQNAVVATAECSGADVLETRAPGYVLVVGPEQIDARRFEQALADARRLPAEERRELLSRARALAGPALAEFAFDAFAQAEIRRLEELASSRWRSASRRTSSSDGTET